MWSVEVYFTVDKNGTEKISYQKPIRANNSEWMCEDWVEGEHFDSSIILPQGSISQWLGKTLTWDDEPFEIKGIQYNI